MTFKDDVKLHECFVRLNTLPKKFQKDLVVYSSNNSSKFEKQHPIKSSGISKELPNPQEDYSKGNIRESNQTNTYVVNATVCDHPASKNSMDSVSVKVKHLLKRLHFQGAGPKMAELCKEKLTDLDSDSVDSKRKKRLQNSVNAIRTFRAIEENEFRTQKQHWHRRNLKRVGRSASLAKHPPLRKRAQSLPKDVNVDQNRDEIFQEVLIRQPIKLETENKFIKHRAKQKCKRLPLRQSQLSYVNFRSKYMMLKKSLKFLTGRDDPSGFLLLCSEIRSAIDEKDNFSTFCDIFKKMLLEWRHMPERKKRFYEIKAKKISRRNIIGGDELIEQMSKLLNPSLGKISDPLTEESDLERSFLDETLQAVQQSKHLLPVSEDSKCSICDIAIPLNYVDSHMIQHFSYEEKDNQESEDLKLKSWNQGTTTLEDEHKLFNVLNLLPLDLNLSNSNGTKYPKNNQCNFIYNSQTCESLLKRVKKRSASVALDSNKKRKIDEPDNSYSFIRLNRSIGGNKTMYVCSICPYKSIMKTSMTTHTLRHVGEKPFKCKQCDYSSVELTHLNRHMRAHAGRPIFCVSCDYRCNQLISLKNHTKNKHMDGALMKCPFCPYETVISGDLMTHYRYSHRGKWYERILKCGKCDFQCYEKQDLINHSNQNECTSKTKNNFPRRFKNVGYANHFDKGVRRKNKRIFENIRTKPRKENPAKYFTDMMFSTSQKTNCALENNLDTSKAVDIPISKFLKQELIENYASNNKFCLSNELLKPLNESFCQMDVKEEPNSFPVKSEQCEEESEDYFLPAQSDDCQLLSTWTNNQDHPHSWNSLSTSSSPSLGEVDTEFLERDSDNVTEQNSTEKFDLVLDIENFDKFEKIFINELQNNKVGRTIFINKRINELGFNFYLCLCNKFGENLEMRNKIVKIFMEQLAQLYIAYSNKFLDSKAEFESYISSRISDIKNAVSNVMELSSSHSIDEFHKLHYNHVLETLMLILDNLVEKASSNSFHNAVKNNENLYKFLSNKFCNRERELGNENRFLKAILNLTNSYASVGSDANINFYSDMLSNTICRLAIFNQCDPKSVSEITLAQWEMAKHKSCLSLEIISNLLDLTYHDQEIYRYFNVAISIGKKLFLIPQPCVAIMDHFAKLEVRQKMNILPHNAYLFPSDSDKPICGQKCIDKFFQNNFSEAFHQNFITYMERLDVGLIHIPENICKIITEFVPKKMRHPLIDYLPSKLKFILNGCHSSYFPLDNARAYLGEEDFTSAESDELEDYYSNVCNSTLVPENEVSVLEKGDTLCIVKDGEDGNSDTDIQNFENFERKFFSELENDEVGRIIYITRRINELGFELYLYLNKYGNNAVKKNIKTVKGFMIELAYFIINYTSRLQINTDRQLELDDCAANHIDDFKNVFLLNVPSQTFHSAEEFQYKRICYENIKNVIFKYCDNLLEKTRDNQNFVQLENGNKFQNYLALKFDQRKLHNGINDDQILKAKLFLSKDYRTSVKNITSLHLFQYLISSTICRLVIFNQCDPADLSKVTLEHWKITNLKSQLPSRILNMLTIREQRLYKFFKVTMNIGRKLILIPLPCVNVMNILASEFVRQRVQISPNNKFLFPSESDQPVSGQNCVNEFFENNFPKHFHRNFFNSYERLDFGLLDMPKSICKLVSEISSKHEGNLLLDSLPIHLKLVILSSHSISSIQEEKRSFTTNLVSPLQPSCSVKVTQAHLLNQTTVEPVQSSSSSKVVTVMPSSSTASSMSSTSSKDERKVTPLSTTTSNLDLVSPKTDEVEKNSEIVTLTSQSLDSEADPEFHIGSVEASIDPKHNPLYQKFLTFENEIVYDEREVSTLVFSTRRILEIGFDYYLSENKMFGHVNHYMQKLAVFYHIFSKYFQADNAEFEDMFNIQYIDVIKTSVSLATKATGSSILENVGIFRSTGFYLASLLKVSDLPQNLLSSVEEFNDKFDDYFSLHDNTSHTLQLVQSPSSLFCGEILIDDVKELLEENYCFPVEGMKIDVNKFISFETKTFCRLVLFNDCDPSLLSQVTINQWKVAKYKSKVSLQKLATLSRAELNMHHYFNTTLCLEEKATGNCKIVLIPEPCVKIMDILVDSSIRKFAEIPNNNLYMFPSLDNSDHPIDGSKFMNKFCQDYFGKEYKESKLNDNDRMVVGLFNIPKENYYFIVKTVANLKGRFLPVKLQNILLENIRKENQHHQTLALDEAQTMSQHVLDLKRNSKYSASSVKAISLLNGLPDFNNKHQRLKGKITIDKYLLEFKKNVMNFFSDSIIDQIILNTTRIQEVGFQYYLCNSDTGDSKSENKTARFMKQLANLFLKFKKEKKNIMFEDMFNVNHLKDLKKAMISASSTLSGNDKLLKKNKSRQLSMVLKLGGLHLGNILNNEGAPRYIAFKVFEFNNQFRRCFQLPDQSLPTIVGCCSYSDQVGSTESLSKD